VSAHGTALQRQEALTAALATMRHRGPDDTRVKAATAAGQESDGADVIMGFNRLAIIDLEHSHQPMEYADGRYLISFNGEIYNYIELREQLQKECGATFTSQGDTEVIAAAYHHWGRDMVHRLRGMFALVIWDSHERVLFGARDCFGIKPLHYLTTPDGLWVASEKKVLLPFLAELETDVDTSATSLDTAALSHYLTLQYIPDPATAHRAIRRLAPGHWFVYRPGGEIEITRYHRVQFRPQNTDESVFKKIQDTLRESVRMHLRSDVPVGCFLSSGIDSTAVVALAREVRPDLQTFTIGYEVSGYDETEVARQSAQWLGVSTITTTIGPTDMMEALPRIVWHLDDPVADPSLVPLYFLARTASQHVTVVLSGEGADELFGGYGIYREPQSLRPLTQAPAPLQRGLRALARVIPEGVRGRSYLERGTTPLEERYYGNARIFTEPEKALLMRQYDPAVRYTDVTAPFYAECAGLDDITRMQYIDIHTWLRGDILYKADRMSMAHSLELRVPFLDLEVLKVAETLPPHWKVTRRGVRKYALRRALEGVVPPAIVNRPKRGFPTPTRVWLADPMYEWARKILTDSAADKYLDLQYALRLLEAHRRGEADHSRKVWTVLVFCIWHAIFVERSIDPTPMSATTVL